LSEKQIYKCLILEKLNVRFAAVADICETFCTAALSLARTYSLIEIVGIGKRSVAVQGSHSMTAINSKRSLKMTRY